MAINKDFVVKNGLVVGGALTANNSTGSSGQVLTSTGSGIYWASVASGGTGATNLTYSANTTAVAIFSDTGTDAIILPASTTISGIVTPRDQIFNGIKTFQGGGIVGNGSPIRATATYGDVTLTALDEFGGITTNGMGVYFSSTSPAAGVAAVALQGDALTFLTGNTSVNTAESMRITSAGDVGIGTTSPSSRLQVVDTAPKITTTRTSDFFYSQVSADGFAAFTNANGNAPIIFRTATTERMRIDSSGKVGIGSTTPTAMLNVSYSPSSSIPALGVAATDVSFGATGSYGTMFGTTSSGLGYIQQQRFDGTATAYNLILQPNGGNIGIGTSVVPATLTIGGVAGGNRSLQIGSAGATRGIITTDGANGIVSIGATNDATTGILTFKTGSSLTERVRIDASGNIGMSTTTPSAKLDVVGDIEVNSNVNLNSEAITLATTAKTQIASFTAASFRSGKLIVQAYDSVTGEVQVTELLVAHNGTTASATEYGVVYTGSNALAIYDVDISAGVVRLLATRTTSNSTQYKTSETLMVA